MGSAALTTWPTRRLALDRGRVVFVAACAPPTGGRAAHRQAVGGQHLIDAGPAPYPVR